ISDAVADPLFPIARTIGTAPTCTGILLDAPNPQSIFATFEAQRGSFGIPPIYFAGFVSTNGGANWLEIPTPEGTEAGLFGGFQLTPGAVQALFNTLGSGGSSGPGYVVEESTDGGATWNAGQLTCPA